MVSKTILKSVVVFALIFGFAVSHAFTEEASVDTAKSFLWRVKSSTSTVYLFGSIHFGKKELYPLNSTIEEAFEKSSTLVVEVNTEAIDEAKMQEQIMLKGLYTGDQTVKDGLSEEVFNMLKDFLEKNGIPLAVVSKLKPGVLSITLTAVELMKLGFSPEHGIDNLNKN